MADVVNDTDMEVDCMVQDGGGGGGEKYVIASGDTLTVEVEDATMTIQYTSGTQESPNTTITNVHNGDTVTLLGSYESDTLEATKT